MDQRMQDNAITKDYNVRFRDSGSVVLGSRSELPGQVRQQQQQDGGQFGQLGLSSPPGHGGSGAQDSAAGSNQASTKPLIDSKIPAAPTLSLPKGGGAVRGMGEKFSVNASNGTASLSIPIKVPPGRSGLQPTLSLTYDSADGNSEFGLGWKLSGVEIITRKTSKGLPKYNDHGTDEEADVFLLAGAEDLVPQWKRDAVSGNVVLDGNGRPLPDETVTDSGYRVRVYVPRIITVFNRVERWTNVSNPQDIHWRVISAENVTAIFGSSDASRIYDPSADASPGASRRIFSWLQDQLYDGSGNAIVFTYKREDAVNVLLGQASELNRSNDGRRANLYLKTIRYGNVVPNRDPATWAAFSPLSLPQDNDTWKYSVVLDYGEHDLLDPQPGDAGGWLCRVDPFSRYQSGYEVRTYRLCQRILVFHHFSELGAPDYLVSSLDLTYDQAPTVTYLTAVEQAGYSGGPAAPQTSSPTATAAPPLRKSLPPVEFDYLRFPSDDRLAAIQVQDVDAASIENLPVGVDNTNYRWVDLDGEGISGILAVFENSWYYKRNTSASNYGSASPSSDSNPAGDATPPKARLGPLEAVRQGPFSTASALNMQFGDVTGSGKLDLVSRSNAQWGYYEREIDDSLGWSEFRPFPNCPNIQPGHSVQFIDVTGDGLADILVTEDQVFNWFESLGPDGYSAPQCCIQSWDDTQGAPCMWADADQAIFLADMSGDGLVDVCRLRNGDCCYWPALGYGKFGAQVTFDNAPWTDYYEQFDHNRVKFTDIDGSGTTDILYVTSEGVDIYLNHAGNSFSDRKHVSLPLLNNMSVLDTIDLLGNGTQCLVWSSPLPCDSASPMKYVDIFANKKPNMLTKVANNLGNETYVQYKASTAYYLEDQQTSRPWITRLRFPVQCVAQSETIDRISGNVFASRYRYSHGYYDGVEREFRGFARVEQTDSTDFAQLKGLQPTNTNVAWQVPPARTVTWYHTGAFFDYSNMSEILSKEYFAPPGGEPVVLDHTILPPECVEGVQQMEACRALKGRVLRTEVFSDDGSDKAAIPFSVQETNYTIVPNQPQQDAHGHGIYFVHARETVAASYERAVEDPRITHQMVLDVDAFGNVRKDLRISYGRQPGKSSLGPVDAAKQEATMMLYNEADLTNSILDDQNFRIPAACDSRQYEITGLKPSAKGSRFQYAKMVANNFSAVLSLPEVAFEDDSRASSNAAGRRLLRRERALFRADNLSAVLPLGTIEPLCVPGAYHKLVFTPGLFARTYTKKNDDGSQEALASASDILDKGYVNLDGDGNLWTSSPRASYATAPDSATAAQELAEARASFFLPKAFFDKFGNPTYTGYDKYLLFPSSSRDALGNISTTTTDYRALQIASIIDPNGNKSSAAYDAMSLVAGVAMSGKPTDNIGDTLDGFKADLAQADLDAFVANPTAAAAAALLGGATSRIAYDPLRVKNAGAPVYSVFISRETHINAPIPAGGALFQVQFTYSDGLSRAIQVMTRTTPGPLADGGSPLLDRWVGSGWTVFNNKGKPVRQFEPFFDSTAAYQPNMTVGVSSIMLYDPLDRPVAVVRADHAIKKTTFNSWEQQIFDENDNVLMGDPRNDSDIGHLFTSIPTNEFLPSWYDVRKNAAVGRAEQDAAAKTVPHNNTPKSQYLDSMGRPFIVMQLTGSENSTEKVDLDILGNSRIVYDALSRQAAAGAFDMDQRQVHARAIDSGDSWILPDGDGKKCMTWNSRGFRFRAEYDQLRRQTNSWWRDAGAASAEVLTSQNIYGENFTSPNAGDSPEAHNLRTRLWRALDQSGILTHTDYDWDGNIIASKRQLATEYKSVFAVSPTMPLDAQEFVTSATYDLLHRPIRSVAPDGTISSRVYNQSTQLDQLYVNTKGEKDQQSDQSTWMTVISSVEYNAKGQLTRIAYGNGCTTVRSYDAQLFRLSRLQTRGTGGSLQDLNYTYDPVGNLTHINDASQQTVFFRNTVVDPSNDYAYDALYRLTSASGREHLGQTGGQAPTGATATPQPKMTGGAAANDGQAMALYTETYTYDLAGNILSIKHAGSSSQSPGWTRQYVYNEPSALEPGVRSNRLSRTTVGSTAETYGYAGSAGLTGNMTAMSHLSLMAWDFGDRLKATAKQVVVATNGDQVPGTTYYVYDSSGTRVRKITESQAGGNGPTAPVRQQERIYLGEYEVFRRYSGGTAAGGEAGEGSGRSPPAPTLERTTFHAITEYGNIVDINSRTVGEDDGVARQARFQLNNHLGSAVLELGNGGELLSYEEFFPLGSTSYRAMPDAAKRYRFSGKELDDENGLYYFGARYMAAWLGRWTAADLVIAGPGSRYDYAANNPVRLVDPDGRDPIPVPAGGGGGSNDDEGWIDIKSSGVIGALVHTVALAVLQERLLMRGKASFAEYRTLGGGSKNSPGNPDRTGEIDLAVLVPKVGAPGKWEAHIYELKPDDPSSLISDYKAYKFQSETQLYAKHFRTDIGPFGEVVEAKPGSVLADIEKGERTFPNNNGGLLDPITISTDVADIRIRLRLQDTNAKGDKVSGLVLYQLQIRPKGDRVVSQALAIEALKAAIAGSLGALLGQLQGQEGPDAPQPVPVDGGGGQQGGGQQKDQGTPWQVYVLGGVVVVVLVGVAVVTWGAATPVEAGLVGGAGAGAGASAAGSGGLGTLLSGLGAGAPALAF